MKSVKMLILSVFLCCMITGLTSSKVFGHSFADWWPLEVLPPYATLPDEELDNPSVIVLANCQFDTRRGEPRIPSELKYSDSEPGMYYYIVQFSEDLDFVACNYLLDMYEAQVLRYIPNNAYLCYFHSEQRMLLQAWSGINWIGLYHPAYKIDPSIGDFSIDSSDTYCSSPTYFYLNISLMEGADHRDVESVIRDVDAEIIYTTAERFLIKVDCGDIIHLSSFQDVMWISQEFGVEPHNATTAWVIQSNDDVLMATPTWDNGIVGDGQSFGIADFGLCATWSSGPQYNGQLNKWTGIVAPDHSAFQNQTVHYANDAQSDPGDCNGNYHSHGTLTTGCAVGNDTQTYLYHGMAYGTDEIYIWDTNNAPYCYAPIIQNIKDVFDFTYQSGQGAKIHNNSWGEANGQPGHYTFMSGDIDRFVWNNQDFLPFHSSGNKFWYAQTLVASPGTAKNCMTVGASRQAPLQNNLTKKSCGGPTTDGRFKPELVISGTSAMPDVFPFLTSAMTEFDAAEQCKASTLFTDTFPNSVGVWGTSFSSPYAAGAGILVRQYFEDGWWLNGVEATGDGINPSAALVKATLINSCENLTGLETGPGLSPPIQLQPRPSNRQGWGRINLDNLLWYDDQPVTHPRLLMLNDMANGFNYNQLPDFYTITVQENPTNPLKITLAWTDYPSIPANDIHLINDLDLKVTAPNQTTYWLGNKNITSGWSQPYIFGNGADNRNNVECVFIENPVPGTYTIQVSPKIKYLGKSGIDFHYQYYGLVATGDV